MNENLNLVEILKDCPKGTKLYSTVFGEVEFEDIEDNSKYPIIVKYIKYFNSFTADGKLDKDFDGECTLFPSKEQRDWAEFKPKKPKFDPKTLQPFDKILVKRGYNKSYRWVADFVTASPVTDSDIKYCTMSSVNADMVIPYNDDTKHLVGTSDDCPEYYKWWEK